MKKGNKFAILIAAGMIALGIFLVIWALPFLYMYIGILEESKSGVINTHWDKLAVKYSIFNAQKRQTIPSAILSFSLAKDYDSVIEYSKKLEELGEMPGAGNYSISKAYMEKGEYQNALKYASYKTQELQIYIKMKDIEKSQEIVNQLLAEKPVKPVTYLYKAEVEILQNNWRDADVYVDKLLAINPQHIDALKVKAKILKHFGRMNEYEKYMQRIKDRESKMRKYGNNN